MYRVVKLVTTLRPNLGFFPRTPAPPWSVTRSTGQYPGLSGFPYPYSLGWYVLPGRPVRRPAGPSLFPTHCIIYCLLSPGRPAATLNPSTELPTPATRGQLLHPEATFQAAPRTTHSVAFAS